MFSIQAAHGRTGRAISHLLFLGSASWLLHTGSAPMYAQGCSYSNFSCDASCFLAPIYYETGGSRYQKCCPGEGCQWVESQQCCQSA